MATERKTPVVQMTLPYELLGAIDQWRAAESAVRYGAVVSRSEAVRVLCATGLAAKARERAITVRRFRLGEEPAGDEALDRLSAGERLAMIGDLTLDAYALKGEALAPGVRRDVVRIVRGRRAVPGRRRVRGRRPH